MATTAKQTRADRVYDLLVERFMEGQWAPGEAINIPSLARDFEVSQTPIREALARLEHTGLIVREALRGYFVAPPFSESDLKKLSEARVVLEPALTRETGNRVTPEFLDELGKTVEELEASTQQEGAAFAERYWAADERFHVMIASMSANPFLEAAYSALSGQLQRLRLVANLSPEDAAHAASEHRAVWEALQRRDADGAARLMTDHIRASTARALDDAAASA